MQPPSLRAFGLSVGEPEEIARTVERNRRWTLNVCAFAVAAVAAIEGFRSEGAAGILWGWYGLIGGTIIGTLLRDRLVALLDSRVPRYLRYEEARKAFEAWQTRTLTEFWLSLSGHAFERELAAVFERAGFDVTRTPGSGDGGIDIILRRGGKTSVVQCKHSKNPIGPSAARDLYGALTHCGAHYGILAVTGTVTSGVHDFFRGKPLRVMPLNEIMALHEATRR